MQGTGLLTIFGSRAVSARIPTRLHTACRTMTIVEETIQLAGSHGLVLRPDTLKVNEMGLDFRVVIAADEDGNSWVLRIPRRPGALARSRQEARTLKFLQEQLPFDVPEWRIHSDSLIAYPLLPGVPGLTFEPPDNDVSWNFDRESETYVQSFAELLVALHGIDTRHAEEAGLSVMSPREAREKMWEDLQAVRDEVGVQRALWDRWQRWLDNDTLWPEHSTLVHGDLYPGHLLVDDNSRVTGVLDWTEARVSDPAADFTGHLMIFGNDAISHLLSRYSALGGKTWPRMQEHVTERQAVAPAQYALFALREGLPDHLAAARSQLLGDESPGG